MIDIVLIGLPFMKCNIDDILIFDKNGKKHYNHLIMVLECLMEHGLKVAS